MPALRTFVLTEAVQMIPLVQSILREVREVRSRMSKIERLLDAGEMIDARGNSLKRNLDTMRRRLALCLIEAREFGFLITDGVRCEALFPFEHRWVGPQGDGKLRPAYFVYNDAQDSISQWFFRGWPNDRRAVNPVWWTQFRNPPNPKPDVNAESSEKKRSSKKKRS